MSAHCKLKFWSTQKFLGEREKKQENMDTVKSILVGFAIVCILDFTLRVDSLDLGKSAFNITKNTLTTRY